MRNVSSLILPGQVTTSGGTRVYTPARAMDGLILPTSPAWISIVREIDTEHYIFIEQRTTDPETLFTTANRGLRFNTQDWSVFALQVQGISETLKIQQSLQKQEAQRLAAMGLTGIIDAMALPADRKRTKGNK